MKILVLLMIVFLSLIILFYITRTKEHFESSGNIDDIASGANHTLFLNRNGAVYASGKNVDGRLGTNTNVSIKMPISIENNMVVSKLFAGNVNSFFITTNGEVYATGENKKGQLGIQTLVSQYIPVLIPFFKSNNIKIEKISAGWFHTLFLSSSGDVYKCGDDNPNPIKLPLQYCKDIGAGQGHSVFLMADGMVYTSGWNWYGQLGSGDTANSTELIKINIENIEKVFAGMGTTILLNKSGKVYVCGNNKDGQLGIGISDQSKEQKTFRMLELDAKIGSVAMGQTHTFFITTTGDVYATGSNTEGQLGIGTNTSIFIPEKVAHFTSKVAKVSAQITYSVFLTEDGIVYECGDGMNKPVPSDIPIEIQEETTYQEEITGVEPVREKTTSELKQPFVPPVEIKNTFTSWITSTTTVARAVQNTNPTYTPHHSSVSGYAGGVVLNDGRIVLIPLKNIRIAIYNPTTNIVSYCSNYVTGGYFGGVLLKDGRVFLANHHPAKPAIYDPVKNTVSSNSVGNGGKHFRGCVLLNDGRVLCIPQKNNTIGLYDPNVVPNTFIKMTYNGTTNNSKWGGGVLLADGRVVFVPRNSNAIGLYDPNKVTPFTLIETPELKQGGEKYESGCLLPDGRVVFAPLNSNNIGIFDPSSKTFIKELFTELPSGGSKYHGCVTLPDGRVLFVPWNAKNVGIYTPSLNGGKGTFARFLINKIPKTFVGAVLMPNGQVLMVPYNAHRIGFINGFPAVPIERCTHAVFNKY
jgi:alpha-tubulin suppressor-like RCC1 family protein